MRIDHSIEVALEDLRRGRMIIVVDDESRENEGDLVVAAEFATPEVINFMAKEARGLICVAMTGSDLDGLGLPLMVRQTDNVSRFGSPFTISVDAREGVTTGISAFDRARTIEALINPSTTSADLSSPGHIFPLRAHDDGVDGRRGHTEAGVDLARAAGLAPASVICEIMADDGTMARRDELETFATLHNLRVVSIEQLSQLDIHRSHARSFQQSDTASLPTRFGDFTVSAFRDKEGREHLALYVGDLGNLGDGLNGDPGHPAHTAPLVRVHSECLTGDVLGSLRCDCGDQLASAMRTISEEGRGVILYLRQEGRGIGLTNKIKAYALQDEGMDTVEANHCLGFSADLRDYSVAASMLLDLGVDRLRLMTNNPHKVADLESNGIEVVERVPLQTARRPENRRYLETKASKLAHILSGGVGRP
ncbi:MAG: GTP cyclohydrolase II [Rhodothermia bacterium]